MAAKTVGFVYAGAFCVAEALAYYCDSDRCGDDEYCCGDNQCCNSYKVWDLWYFWMGFIFFLFLLSLCTCLWRFKNTRGPFVISSYSYSPLRDSLPDVAGDPSGESGLTGNRGGSHFFANKPASPPPYSPSQPPTPHMKNMAPPPAYSEVVGGGGPKSGFGH